MLSSNVHMKLSAHDVLPNMRVRDLEDLQKRADSLGFAAARYGLPTWTATALNPSLCG